jgi:hypothetical protein
MLSKIPSIREEKVSNMENFLQTIGPVAIEILTIASKSLSSGSRTMFRNDLTLVDISIYFGKDRPEQ